MSTPAHITEFTAYAEAVDAHAETGGYLVRSGAQRGWLVIEGDIRDAQGFRDLDAYGVNLATVTPEQWSAADWDETHLDGYRD